MTKESASANTALRDLVAEAGFTYDALARTVNAVAAENGERGLRANRSAVCHWVAGTVPAPRTRAFLAEVFSRRLARRVTIHDLGLPAGDDEDLGLAVTGDAAQTLAQVSELAVADLRRRAFLTSAAYSVIALTGPLALAKANTGSGATGSELVDVLNRGQAAVRDGAGRHVGQLDVDAVRQLTAAFTAIDERLGGDHGRAAVVTYLAEDVTALCRGSFTSDRVRQAMFSSAAQVAYLAGWKAHDAGKESLAQRYYLQALGLADHGQPGHASYVLRILAHHAMDIGRPDRCIQLAQAAWARRDTTADPGTAASLALTLSRAHAYCAQPRQAMTWLAHGEDLLTRGAGDPPAYWSGLTGPAETIIASHAAKTFVALGEHRRAEPYFDRAARRWSGDTHPRVRALTLAQLAQTRAAQGHLEHACEAWTLAMPALASTRSARTRDALRTMRATLNGPRTRTLPAARQLLDRIQA